MGAMIGNVWVVVALAVCTVGLTDGVQAQSAHQEADRHLADGRRLYRELDFLGCVDAMNRALAVPGIADAQRLDAFEYLGAAFVVLDREDEAERAFREMFRLDAYHVVREPSGSPKIEQFVDELRARLVVDAALDRAVSLRAHLPRAGFVGADVPVRVEVEGPTENVATMALYIRADDETSWTRVPLTGTAPTFEGVLRSDHVGELELYVEARDHEQRVVARGGGPLLPLTVRVRAADRTRGDEPRRWWLWAIVGVLVVGAAVGIGVWAADGDRISDGTLPPGRVELPLGW